MDSPIMVGSMLAPATLIFCAFSSRVSASEREDGQKPGGAHLSKLVVRAVEVLAVLAEAPPHPLALGLVRRGSPTRLYLLCAHGAAGGRRLAVAPQLIAQRSGLLRNQRSSAPLPQAASAPQRTAGRADGQVRGVFREAGPSPVDARRCHKRLFCAICGQTGAPGELRRAPTFPAGLKRDPIGCWDVCWRLRSLKANQVGDSEKG
eukprot:scaffold3499_cov247-Pinguiococcus_pyrenoidosus.AAC.14